MREMLLHVLLVAALASASWPGALSWDPGADFFTCDNMVHNTSDHAPLFNCTHDEGAQEYRCGVVLGMTGQNFQTTNLAVGLSLRPAAEDPRCLLLAAVNVSQAQPAPGDTGAGTVPFGDLDDNNIYLQIQRLSVRLRFPQHVPFGRLCTEDSPYRPSACLDRQTALVTAVIRHATASRKGVLSRLSYMHDAALTLGAELLELRAEVNGLVDLRLQQVLDLLEGTRAHAVALRGGNWSDTPLNLTAQPLLTELDLASCRIANVNTTDFGQVRGLRSLVLQYNYLRHIPAGLRLLEHLQELDLSNNPLQHTDSVHVLGQLPALRSLRLSGCGIKSLPPRLSLPSGLLLLNLSGNELRQMPPPLPASLRRLILDHNDFYADLRLSLHADTQLQLVDLASNFINNTFDVLRGDKVREQPWTEVLDLSYNKLQALPRAAARRLRRSVSRAVLLHGNPWNCYECDSAPLRDWLIQPPEELPRVEGEVVCANPPGLRVRDLVGCSSVDHALAVGAPLAALALLAALVAALCYAYRFELTYLRHILGVKVGAAARGRRRPGVAGAADGADFKYDAFVSYSASDREWVLYRLLPGLERAPERFRLCLHERDFAPGTFITINIVSSMQASRRMIVVLSEAFVASQWCQWELDMAKHQVWEDGSDFLLLLELERLERRRLPRHLRDFMETRTYLEWPAPPAPQQEEAVAWGKLRAALSPSLHQLRQRQRQLQRAASQRRRQHHRDQQLQMHTRRSAPPDDTCSDVTDVTSA